MRVITTPLAWAMRRTLAIKPLSAWLGRVLSRHPALYEGTIRLGQRVGALPDPRAAAELQIVPIDLESLSPRARGIYERLAAAQLRHTSGGKF